MTDEDDDDDESDKHLQARDRRYSCLIWMTHLVSHDCWCACVLYETIDIIQVCNSTK